ncbi:MAG TPA: pyrroline-5-carboxylate reductase [Steroidobacteraceae bacterium]|nr:pyrroline-5-carboxylate reductase [Steroidobacteraceae bacterium]
MQSTESATIAFIGGGNMARALIAGLLRQGVAPGLIRVGEPQPQARVALQREWGVESSADNADAARGASLVVLAVKPQEAGHALRALYRTLLERKPVVLSIAAGLRLADLARACPDGTAVVRAMPNRPALLGAGVTGLYAPPSVTAAQRALAERVAAAAGRAVWLRTEAELDVVTALSGSGPAYFFLLAEQMAQAATSLGLERSTAALLAAETLYGAGLLAHEGTPLAEQRAAVTSSGGTTEAALHVLYEGGLEALIARALRAASERSAQLADMLSSAQHTERQ